MTSPQNVALGDHPERLTHQCSNCTGAFTWQVVVDGRAQVGNIPCFACKMRRPSLCPSCFKPKLVEVHGGAGCQSRGVRLATHCFLCHPKREEDRSTRIMEKAQRERMSQRGGDVKPGKAAAGKRAVVKNRRNHAPVKQTRKRKLSSEAATPSLQRTHAQHATILRDYDLNPLYGPRVGLRRLTRWRRASKYGHDPPEAVLELLQKDFHWRSVSSISASQRAATLGQVRKQRAFDICVYA